MNPALSDAVNRVMQLLYEGQYQQLTRKELDALKAELSQELLELAIEKLRRADLVVASVLEGSIRKSGPGLKAFLSDTHLALTLGKEYIAQFSRPSIFHIVVSGKADKPAAGTGFFCADAGNRLVTAAHNVIDREIKSVEGQYGLLNTVDPIKVRIVDGLDLAILDIIAPSSVPSLRIERDKEEILQLRPVYVVGFPQIPQQTLPPVIYRSAEFSGIGQDFKRRETYLITNVTSPGFSGGPVLNDRGRVVGVVKGMPDAPVSTAGEDALNEVGTAGKETDFQKYDTGYSVLTPAHYIEELMSESKDSDLSAIGPSDM